MPHIRIDSLEGLSLPCTMDDIAFHWQADNVDFPGESLLSCSVRGTPFFLQVKPKGEDLLVKAEKITRPSPNTLVKEALKALIDKVSPRVYYSNIASPEKAMLKEPLPCLKEIGTFDEKILPDKPLWIEVGFGSGRHLLHQAKARPDVHLIGLEIHRPSLEQVMRRIDLEGVDNVWVIDYDARLFMELLPSNRVERIFVHFPVPWDKKPHRRVISDDFLKESLRVLRPGGTLELRTDSDNYFRYAMEVFLRPRTCRLAVEKNAEAAVRSKYEDRWRRMQKDIYEVHVSALEESPPRVLPASFEFEGSDGFEALLARRPQNSHVAGDFFVHFERFYRIREGEGVIRLSFGSFDRPEHKYLVIEGEKPRYFPEDPVPTAANAKAHQYIKEWLCQASSRPKS
ncbi:MAG: tRNA (guanosine(46)-N7)-methyltransferase TrmB [Epsilonproteobacteria bacterium]|nr:tRNA (guanosine(46)-N7)-methyltransferase TrmB [Campylobacterota bacterium]